MLYYIQEYNIKTKENKPYNLFLFIGEIIMSNEFKKWIEATKKDEENLNTTKTFLKLVLLSTDETMVEHQSEAQLILDYLNSDETEVPRRVEMSVANILKMLSGGVDPENNFELSNLRKSFEKKASK